MREYIQMITTVPREEDAKALAGHLVRRKLAACVQILGPVTSVYRWKGEVQQSVEWICFIKTAADLYPEVQKAITEAHPYEIPEVVALPLTRGSEAYFGWLQGCLKDGAD